MDTNTHTNAPQPLINRGAVSPNLVSQWSWLPWKVPWSFLSMDALWEQRKLDYFLSESDKERERESVCLYVNCKCICMRASRWPSHSLYSSGKRISPLYKVAVCKLIGHRAMWRRSFWTLVLCNQILVWIRFLWHACGWELECTSDTVELVTICSENAFVNVFSTYSPWLLKIIFVIIINLLYD